MSCIGEGSLPRMMWRNAEDSPDASYGMCPACTGRVLMVEIVPPSNPNWKREFRVGSHKPAKEFQT